MAHYGHSMGRGVSPSDAQANDTMAHRMALDAAIARVRALKARAATSSGVRTPGGTTWPKRAHTLRGCGARAKRTDTPHTRTPPGTVRCRFAPA